MREIDTSHSPPTIRAPSPSSTSATAGTVMQDALVVGAEGVEPSTSVESGRRSTDELSTRNV